MAGDWIKVEHATLDKPEVLRTAEMLGIGRREAVGLFFEFWIWLDKNLSGSCPDFVRNVSRKGLDDVLHCPGFAACLESVGWAEFDDALWILRVKNANRHNGNTAKTRGLDAKRKREKRLDFVRETSGCEPDKNRTREEKRRDIPTNVGIDAPTEEHRALAIECGVQCDTEWQKYRDHLAANGRRHKDAVAGFRNWLRKAAEFAAAKPKARTERAASTMDILTGRARDERTIFAERVDRAPVLAIAGDLREPDADDVGADGPAGGPRSVG